MSDRMTPERMREIRYSVNASPAYRVPNDVVVDLLTELAAVTRELDEAREVTAATLHTAFRAGVEWACGQGEITEPIRELIDLAAIEYGENPDPPIASAVRS